MAVEQAQQSLEFAAVVGGGVELEGKSASIKSSSECIQSSNASSFSSCFVLCSERSICISTAGSRRQLSIRKNERKGDNDDPDAPLLLEWELALGEGDVVIRGEERDQANNTANNGFQNCFAVEPKPPPGQRHFQITRDLIHVKQPAPIPAATSLVRTYHLALRRLRPCPPPPRLTFPPCSPADWRQHRRGRGAPPAHDSEALVFNLDKCGYASDLTSIEQVLAELGDRASTPKEESRYQLPKVERSEHKEGQSRSHPSNDSAGTSPGAAASPHPPAARAPARTSSSTQTRPRLRAMQGLHSCGFCSMRDAKPACWCC